ncbi:hypothetical protein V8F33_001794 [Rhypophila sp. PSN 637]
MFESLEVNAEHIPAYKLGVHIAQVVFALVLWILEIVVFRAKDAPVTGAIGWTFAVCFLSIPAWLYLAMAPRFPRTRKFAEPRAMAVVDGLFAIIWLSAFATQASYNTAGLCGSVCGVSKAIVGLGFFVFLFFCVSTFISIWTIQYWKWNNRLPGYDTKSRGGVADPSAIDPDKAAFSMAPHGDDAYAPVNMNDHDNDPEIPLGGGVGASGAHSDYADPYGAPRLSPDPYGGPSVPPAPSSYGGGSVVGGQQANPFRDDNPFDDDTAYNPGGRTSAMGGSMGSRYAAPTAQDEYDDARFPSANYDRITR